MLDLFTNAKNFIGDFFFRKKIDKYLENDHVAIGDQKSGEPTSIILNCLIRGLIIFLGTFGTIAGLLSAFNMEYDIVKLAVALLITSVGFALLYAHKALFYPGYIFTMLGFTIMLVKYYAYANSGYQAAINTIYSDYSDFFNLLSVREAQEIITNRYDTITVAAIFMGIFIALLLNVTISGYMNLPETILVTFPFLEIAYYIGKKPNFFYIWMVLICYIFVGIMQASKHGRSIVTGIKKRDFMRNSFGKKHFYIHQAGTHYLLTVTGISTVIAILIILISLPVYSVEINKTANNKIRKTTDEYVKTFVQTGFYGLFSRYNSTGGLSRGRLGGVGAVRPDFETDLEVTFVPYSTDTIYLKSYIGNTYVGSQWFDTCYPDPVSKYLDSAGAFYYDTDSLNTVENIHFDGSNAKGLMTIHNVAAADNVYYEPFFTDQESVALNTIDYFNELGIENPNPKAKFPEGTTATLEYSPNFLTDYSVVKTDPLLEDENYYNYVNYVCLEVPENIKESLDTFLETSSNEVLHSPKDLSLFQNNENNYRIYVANSIYGQFLKDYSYTMQPGATPTNKDFVQYFLDTQHRGYCAHFASSTVMLLREMGIPARYVEGYAISFSSLSENATAVKADYEDWYTGENLLDEHGVLKTTVNDSQAHAWVEIYLEGYGFVPFEATIPSDDDITETGSFLSDIFNGLFNQINIENPDNDPGTLGSNGANNLSGRFNSLLEKINIPTNSLTLPLVIMLSVFAATIVLFIVIRQLISIIKQIIWYRSGNYKKLVYFKYTQLANKLNAKGKINNPLPQDCKEIYKDICSKKSIEFSDELNVFDLVEYALYSPSGITKEQYDTFIKSIKKIRKNI